MHYVWARRNEVFALLDEGKISIEYLSEPVVREDIAVVVRFQCPHRERGSVRAQLGFVKLADNDENLKARVHELETFQLLQHLVRPRTIYFPGEELVEEQRTQLRYATGLE